jgi:glyoxylase-like metal-dependent hydrolase (beta-lactamase superfamily II)/predicted DCC family thiol-disulfide oxidoreductase YuxK
MPSALQVAASADPAQRTFKVFYDGECEICQAGVSWIRILDSRRECECIAISPEALEPFADCADLDACLRELHVIAPDGTLYVGADAVARLARNFRPTAWIGVLAGVTPFRQLSRFGYRFVARNRYALSKCRGGACRVSKPDAVRKRAGLGAFWSCHTIGLAARLPLIAASAIRTLLERIQLFVRTRNRRLDLLDGRLSILFLGGFFPNAIPIVFGELFTMIFYNGFAIDPGSPKMRRSLARHLKEFPLQKIRAIVATHAHEEHVGNLNWLAQQAGAPVFVSRRTAEFLSPPKKLPFIRALMIGQPPALEPPFELLGDVLEISGSRLQVIPTPGHCDDHISLYDPVEKILLAGDTFMGTYFATPNPDVDSRIWFDTLARLSQLDIEILVEGHGHIHTLRPEIPDIPGVVIREHPRAAILEKLAYMNWLRRQIESGFQEGLPIRAIEASCFPWTKRTAWENFANDELTRLLSLGHFSRSELVRSFVRDPASVLPTVYQVKFYGDSRKE